MHSIASDHALEAAQDLLDAPKLVEIVTIGFEPVHVGAQPDLHRNRVAYQKCAAGCG